MDRTRPPKAPFQVWTWAALAVVLGAGLAIGLWLPPLPLFLAYGRDGLWIPRWLPTLAIPGAALVLGTLGLPRLGGRWRPAGLTLLLLLPVVQGGVLAPALALRFRSLRRPVPEAASQRQYRPIRAGAKDWPDPGQPLWLDLGGGVGMAMATTCYVDAQGRTLPRAKASPPPPGPVADSTHQPSALGLANLAAFTRALGCLRFFHPADEASGADWPRLAAQGLAHVEDAAGPGDLARRLTDWFAPWAPTVQFLPGGSANRPPPPAPPEARGLVRWCHRGPGCGANPAEPGLEADPQRGIRLAGVALIWTTFRHFHPWLDGTDWNGPLTGALAEAAQAADTGAYQAVLQKLTATIKDGHIIVFRTGVDDQAQPPLALAMVEGRALVARRWGEAEIIPVGSRILAVDGEPEPERSRRMASRIASATEGWARTRLAQSLLAGTRETPVTVHYRTPEGALGQARLHRTETAFAVMTPGAAMTARPRPGIGYVDLSRCAESDWASLLPLLQESQGIVFDLRGYPKDFELCRRLLAHLACRPLWSPRWLEPVFTRPDQEAVAWDASHRWTLAHRRPRVRGRAAFLVGGGSFSAAETLLAMVAHYRLGILVGEPTAGCNGDLNVTTLPGGVAVAWTGLRVLNHDGSPHQGVGIRPEILVRPTAQGLARGRDEVLERALAVVQASLPSPHP
jgi:hypothetical protein